MKGSMRFSVLAFPLIAVAVTAAVFYHFDSVPAYELAEIVEDSEDFAIFSNPVDTRYSASRPTGEYRSRSDAATEADDSESLEYDDPHDDPRWRATRRSVAMRISRCQVRGCNDNPNGDAIHHGLSAMWCVRAGCYKLAVEEAPGQTFYRLCEKHHGPIGHGIGHGGSWRVFNPDIDADVRAGKFNSRGMSRWFDTDEEAIEFILDKVRVARGSVRGTERTHRKTVLSP